LSGKTVVITGASGFIGKHVTKEFLDNGYHVRGSVRSDAKALETKEAVGGDYNGALSFVELDLLKDDGWSGALEGADFLVHTASPFPLASPKDPQELIRPAVDGTLRALKAAKNAGIDRVVITSSCVAIYNDTLDANQNQFDETNWSPTEKSFTSAYEDSKTLAELAAWDFVKSEAPQMQLSTVNPGAVFGVPLDANYGASLELVERLLKGQDPMLPDLSIPIVDVVDVALMHRLALETDAAAGQRFPACSGALTMIEAAKILNAEISSSKAKTRQAPNWLIKLMAKVNSEMKTVAPRLGRAADISSKNAESKLGMKLVSPKDTLLASAHFLVQSN